MSKIQCAAQKRAIAELSSSTYKPIDFIEQPDSNAEQIIGDAKYFMQLFDRRLDDMDRVIRSMRKSKAQDDLADSLESVKDGSDELYGSVIQLSEAWMPDTRWAPDMLDALRALLYDIDCTTASGQAEIRGVVKVLEVLGLVGCSVSEHEKVA